MNMNLENLVKEIENIDNYKNKSLSYYNNLIDNCTKYNEMEAVVYLYDHMIKNNIKPNEETYKSINRLHSKTIKENNQIYIKNLNRTKRLAPRRRIHKIMKGHLYSAKYNNAKKHEEKVRQFLDNNNQYKMIIKQRIKLAKIISKNCNIPFNDARFIITSLKRQKYFNNSNKNEKKTMTKIVDTSKTKTKNTKQQSILSYFNNK
jgi:pentatricopeptide repeat protein